MLLRKGSLTRRVFLGALALLGLADPSVGQRLGAGVLLLFGELL